MLDMFIADRIILNAFREDFPCGDVTTDSLISDKSVSEGYFIAKQPGVIAGLDIVKRVFTLLDKNIVVNKQIEDGEFVKAREIIMIVKGSTGAILKGERTALNFLQRMSGIATQTYHTIREIKNLSVKIADTRKTTPGLRYLEKYAVRKGGGSNHRYSLSDAVLIKDNHIQAVGDIKTAVTKAREKIPHTMKIEIETETLEQVEEAVKAGADIIMLDNMQTDTMRKAVELINKRALVEASGNINMNTIHSIAATGVDIISMGSLTHSVSAMDISLKFFN